jgi:putative ABC transport system permease protein
VLRAAPVAGRWFTREEGTPGAAQTAVLSDRLWLRRFGRNPQVIGQAVLLGGVATHVVGVMPASFAFPDPRIDAWIAEPLAVSQGFGLWNYRAVARLNEGRTVEEARSELTGLIADLPQAYPADPLASGNAETGLIVTVRPLKDAIVGGVSRLLWMLLTAVGLVLLVACANVANLFLVRSDARQREVAVRRALGANNAGIARYFLAESLLLSIAGGAIGLALAWGAVRLLVVFGPANLPRVDEVRLDGVAVAFTFVLSLAAALVFGIIPLWRGAPAAVSLSDGGRSNTATRSRHRARHVLMGAQVAMALMLLVSAGLMVRSLQNTRALDPGFDPASALTFSIGLPESDYPSRDAAVTAHHAILDRLSTLPGVTAVAASTCLPLGGACYGNTLHVLARARQAVAERDNAATGGHARGVRRLFRDDGDPHRARPQPGSRQRRTT